MSLCHAGNIWRVRDEVNNTCSYIPASIGGGSSSRHMGSGNFLSLVTNEWLISVL